MKNDELLSAKKKNEAFLSWQNLYRGVEDATTYTTFLVWNPLPHDEQITTPTKHGYDKINRFYIKTKNIYQVNNREVIFFFFISNFKAN